MFPFETVGLLKSLNYSQYCVLSDLDFSIRVESAWQSSYVIAYNPGSRRTRAFRFPNERNCALETNLTLSNNKQEFICNGGRINSCGYKALPELQQHSATQFIRYANFDPQGIGSWVCTPPEERKSFTFSGSYYYGYVKMAQCSPPMGKFKMF